jgi:hypothetical protein
VAITRGRWALALAFSAVVSATACVSTAPDGDRPDGAIARASRETPDGATGSPSDVETSHIADECDGGAAMCGRLDVRLAFHDVTNRSRASTVKPRDTWGALWADNDGDGDPDLFVGRHEWPPELFINDGGAYSRANVDFVHPSGYDSIDDETGVDRHSCAWGEANGDGLPDLYCAVGANRGTSVGPNQLFLAEGDGFREAARELGVTNPFGRSKSVGWLDHDGDGDLDLLVGNALRLDRRAPNALFERTKDGFARVKVGLDDELVTMSTSWADWDVDGDPDVLVLQYPSSRQPTVAYENVGGTFREVTLPNVTGGPWHAAAWGDVDGNARTDLALVSIERLRILRNTRAGFRPVFEMALDKGQMALWFDAENDGDLDLFVVQGAPPPMEWFGANYLDFLLVRGPTTFRHVALTDVQGPRDGCGDSAAAADYDRDGDVDLFVTNGAEGGCRGIDELLENRSTGGNWVALDLVGPAGNPWAFGARLHVGAGEHPYWREVTDGVTFRSQSEVGHQVLGIGPAASANVRVLWPDGASDCVRLDAGSTATVAIGSSPCRT